MSDNILKRYDVVSRWHDHLDFQNRDVYRLVGEENPEGEWVKWADVDALLRAQPPPAPDWQPIETAPKDGTEILVGGGRCPYVHINAYRYFGNGEPVLKGLGNKQQPAFWMPIPKAPKRRAAPPAVEGTHPPAGEHS